MSTTTEDQAITQAIAFAQTAIERADQLDVAALVARLEAEHGELTIARLSAIAEAFRQRAEALDSDGWQCCYEAVAEHVACTDTESGGGQAATPTSDTSDTSDDFPF